MKIESLMSVLAAAHLTYALDGVPDAFSQRGGIMLVGPPENMKTTIAMVLQKYSNSLAVGDLTVRQLVKVRDQISAGKYQTIVLPAFEKIYKRDLSTASNVEGLIQAMVEEGFSHAAFEDQETFVRHAKCLVIGALVEEVYRQLDPAWRRGGFTRRFLWCHFILDDPFLIQRAIHAWKPIEFTDEDLPGIPSSPIPFNVTDKERRQIATIVFSQEGKATPYILAIKILAVLKWRYRHEKDAGAKAWSVFLDFGECLTKRGARLIV